jgi:hypothetical protein
MPHPLPKRDAIDAVPIAQQISRFFVPREGVNDLLGGPRGGRVLGDVDMHHAAPFMGQDQQHEEHFVGHCRHHKEIQSHQVLHVVLQKGLPSSKKSSMFMSSGFRDGQPFSGVLTPRWGMTRILSP